MQVHPNTGTGGGGVGGIRRPHRFRPGTTSTHSLVLSTLSNNPSNTKSNSLNNYSQPTKAYIDSFKDKEKNTDMLKDLKLLEDEKNLFEKYSDPITNDVINIPVILNERLYDLNTLTEIQQRDKQDPFTRIEFFLRDIQPSRKNAEKLQKIISQIKERTSVHENGLRSNINCSVNNGGITKTRHR